MQLRRVADAVLCERRPLVVIQDWLFDFYRETETRSELEALELVELATPGLVFEIKTKLERLRREAVTPPFRLDESAGCLVRVETDLTGSGSAVSAADRRALESAVAEISADQFEYLCLALVQLYGASQAQVIGGSGDQGIDLVARLDVPAQAPGSGRLRTAPVRLLVQVKKWTSPVTNDAAQAFGGRVAAARSGGELLRSLPMWFQADKALPILGLMVSSGSFAPSAIDAATRNFVYCVAGDQLLEDLVRCARYPRWLVGGRIDSRAIQEDLSVLAAELRMSAAAVFHS